MASVPPPIYHYLIFAINYINAPQICKRRMAIKNHDFIEIDYTGKLEDGTVFDTTDENTAKNAGLSAQQNASFGPVTVCVGENHILKGIEEYLIGKEPGDYEIRLEAEHAFGKKNAKLLRLIPMKIFRKEKINPFPGLEVNIDNAYGIVRTVSGGRVIVDFNHPLSGRAVTYSVNVLGLVNDPLKMAKAVLKNELNAGDLEASMDKDKLMLDERIPEEAIDAIKKRILELIPNIRDVLRMKKKEEKSAEKKTDKEEKSEESVTGEKS